MPWQGTLSFRTRISVFKPTQFFNPGFLHSSCKIFTMSCQLHQYMGTTGWNFKLGPCLVIHHCVAVAQPTWKHPPKLISTRFDKEELTLKIDTESCLRHWYCDWRYWASKHIPIDTGHPRWLLPMRSWLCDFRGMAKVTVLKWFLIHWRCSQLKTNLFFASRTVLSAWRKAWQRITMVTAVWNKVKLLWQRDDEGVRLNARRRCRIP